MRSHKTKKKLTIVQWITIGLIFLYLLWEFVFLVSWKENTKGPLIRIDLIIIYPLIFMGAVMSMRQYFKGRS